MKKLSFFNHAICLSMFLLVAFTACQKEEQTNQVDFQLQTPIATTHEAKVMQQTTNVIVSMLNENPTLFNDINEAIKSDAIEYMEDRILFADLFKNPQFVKSNVSQLNPVSFASEFRKHASINIQYAPAETRATTLDADALMQYLIDNNISVYCPFPLEDYEDDNRIPAIAANIGEEYEELPGVQFHADGTYDSVMVSQAYADLHPVWLINPEEDYIFEKIYSRNTSSIKRIINADPLGMEIVHPGIIPTNPKPAHYEVKFNSIFVSNYFGPITEGELKIYFCTTQTTPIYDTENEIFKSTFDRISLIPLPRKYVKYAKNREARGWVAINYVLDQDWQTTELQQYFAAYEYDKKMDKTLESTLDYSYTNENHTINAHIALTLNYSEKDDLICVDRFERSWMFGKISNSDVTYVDDSGITKTEAPDGYKMIAIGSSPAILVSVKKNIYY